VVNVLYLDQIDQEHRIHSLAETVLARLFLPPGQTQETRGLR